MTVVRASGGATTRSAIVYDDAEALSRAAAALFAGIARESVDLHGRFAVALAGGETPRRTYEVIAERYAERIAWRLTDVFFTDERCVPPDDPLSNFGMANRALLSRVPVERGRVHSIPAFGIPPMAGAERYEAELRRYFTPIDETTRPATFDLVMLGIGADGHTASLFPGDPAASEARRWVVPVDAPAGITPRRRISLTVPVLSAARHVILLAAGVAKRRAVIEALDATVGAGDGSHPAATVSGTASTRWLLDAGASP